MNLFMGVQFKLLKRRLFNEMRLKTFKTRAVVVMWVMVRESASYQSGHGGSPLANFYGTSGRQLAFFALLHMHNKHCCGMYVFTCIDIAA